MHLIALPATAGVPRGMARCSSLLRVAVVLATVVDVQAQACISAASDSSTSISVIYRDFTSSNADFDRGPWSYGQTTGLVASTLGANGRPSCISVSGNFTTRPDPYAQGVETMLSSCDGLNNTWYVDTPGTNSRVDSSLTLSYVSASSRWEYESESYFPLDGLGFNDQTVNTDANPQVTHNYYFTSELHFDFVYLGGACQQLVEPQGRSGKRSLNERTLRTHPLALPWRAWTRKNGRRSRSC